VTLGMHLCSACDRRTTNALDNDDDELQWKGVHVVGAGPGSLGEEVPQKLKQNVKLVYIF